MNKRKEAICQVDELFDFVICKTDLHTNQKVDNLYRK